jgi:hypothetical protein
MIQMKLTNRQSEGLKIAISRYKHNEKYTVISGYAGTGKAQPVNTEIPTPNGIKKLKELKIGDFVFDRHGNPTKILGIYPQGVIDNYKITLEDGRITYCNDEHIWAYYTSKGNLSTKTVKEMLNMGIKHNGRGGYKFKIPNITKPVEFNNCNKKLSIDPYVIGAFLGDGCCKQRQLTLSSEDEEIVAEISKLIQAKQYRRNSENNYNWTFLLSDEKITKYNGIDNIAFITRDFFKEYNDSLYCGAEEKRIPNDYKYTSIENRYSLLQGLLDTDGNISRADGRYNIRYTSINLLLIKDVKEILASLGYKSTITEDNRKDKYTNNICYNLNINIPNEEKYKLFRLKRKKDIALEAKNKYKRKDYSKIAIVDIEKMDKPEEMLCIYVDNPEHLYLTNDYIVTHNTTLVHSIVEALDIDEAKIAYCSFTGKAAEVLRKKGNKNAMTLHKLLYESFPKSNGGFYRRPKMSLEYSIIIVDEVSMVPKSMVDLLLRHPVYVIFLGDPFQLEQIDKNDFQDLLAKPHVFLDEIMRQAAESEIIQLTMKIRNGEKIDLTKGKEVIVIPKRELVTGHLQWADQIICATNSTRLSLNSQMRALLGYSGIIQSGEKLLIKRNYWGDYSLDESEVLVNGCTGNIINPFENFRSIPPYIKNNRRNLPVVTGEFISESNKTFGNIEFDKDFLLTGKPCVDWKVSYKLNRLKDKIGDILPRQATYGYCITGHCAQGSQWKKVLVIEEDFPFDKLEHARWLYTCCTRPEEKLVLVR